MNRAYYSSVLNHNIDYVWSLIRDFNNYPCYIEGVTESIIENGKAGDEIGAIRRFKIGDNWERQQMVDHSDTEHSFSYSGMEPREFPSDNITNTITAVDYSGTLRLIPIIEGDRTFIEWFVEFDCPPKDTDIWRQLFMSLIPQWVSSLDNSLNNK